MLDVPGWLTSWIRSGDTGTSSKTIAFTMVGAIGLVARFDAPSDTSDVGRCIRLLDLAAANGEDWRARLPEMAEVSPVWAVLVPVWSEIEAAFAEDVAVQREARQAAMLTKSGRRRKYPVPHPCPPSRCWWLVAKARGGRDPYASRKPHPFVPPEVHDGG
jgi:hypothetical protein